MENNDVHNPNPLNRPGHTNFSRLIRQGDIYVDKTSIIQALLTDKFNTVLLNRPRRFGKSLLISTIEHILKGDKEKFKTLDIGQDDSGYVWKSSHVIRLDMSKYGTNAKILANDLSVDLHDMAEESGICLYSTGSGASLAELIKKLYRNYKDIPLKRADDIVQAEIPYVAVLVDEYDYPLVMNLNRPKTLNKMRKFFAEFYASLKSVSEMTRFVFIAGITRFEEFTSFSGMNRFGDISFNPEYSKICGFTQKEIEKNFKDDLNKAHESLKADKSLGCPNSSEEILSLLMDWYDGYSWDGKNRVLNPVSVLYFFDSFEFGRYWYDTGAPSFLQELQIKDEKYFNNFSNSSDFRVSITYPQTKKMSPASSLLATGYLTVDKAEGGTYKGHVAKTYHLAIPNMEVRMSYAQDHLVGNLYPNISDDEQTRFVNLSKKFCSSLCDIDADDAADCLSSIFAGIPYDYHSGLESFYKSHMNTALAFARGFVFAEKHSGDGRPDFILETRRQVLVIEVKYSKSDDPSVNVTLDNPDRQLEDTVDGGKSGSSSKSGETDVQGKDGDNDGSAPIKAGDRKSGGAGGSGTGGNGGPLALLNNGISAAFDQILHNAYALEFLDGTKDVWAVAVSIVGRTGVKIQFKEIKRKQSG
ncbi:MAG: AAA family ATPase [Deltaproteobacteria bacterium]|nr:AAA family ATPase [Deltaproteobacteria bacterium]